MGDTNQEEDMLEAESWSVQYNGVPYDDARRVGESWYFRDVTTGKYARFPFQEKVVRLCKNDLP
jgi:hypothetical protein